MLSDLDPYETVTDDETQEEEEEELVVGAEDEDHHLPMMAGEDDWVDGSVMNRTNNAGVVVDEEEDDEGVLIVPAEDDHLLSNGDDEGIGMRSRHSEDDLSIPDTLPSEIRSIQDSATISTKRSTTIRSQYHQAEEDDEEDADFPAFVVQRIKSLNRSYYVVPGLVVLLIASVAGNVYLMRQEKITTHVSSASFEPERIIEPLEAVEEEPITYPWDEQEDDSTVLVDNCWAQVKFGSCASNAKRDIEESAQWIGEMLWQTEELLLERASELLTEAKTIKGVVEEESYRLGNSFWDMQTKFRERADDYFSETESNLKDSADSLGDMFWKSVDTMQDRVQGLFSQTEKAINDVHNETKQLENKLIEVHDTVAGKVSAFVEKISNINNDTKETAEKKEQDNTTNSFVDILGSRGFRRAATVFVSGVAFASVATLLNSISSDGDDEN